MAPQCADVGEGRAQCAHFFLGGGGLWKLQTGAHVGGGGVLVPEGVGLIEQADY